MWGTYILTNKPGGTPHYSFDKYIKEDGRRKISLDMIWAIEALHRQKRATTEFHKKGLSPT